MKIVESFAPDLHSLQTNPFQNGQSFIQNSSEKNEQIKLAFKWNLMIRLWFLNIFCSSHIEFFG